MRAARPLLLGTLVAVLALGAGTVWKLDLGSFRNGAETPVGGAAAEAPPRTVDVAETGTTGDNSPASADDELLPTPPDPPRLADGPEYERCLALLRTDAEGARAFADAWEATGGGEGAQHCAALAILAAGDPERAANRLEQIAGRSHAGPAARAAVYAQAGQAWLMVGNTDRAFGAITLALTLTPSDIDLLVDRSVALAAAGRYADAIEDLNRAVDLDPRRADAWVFRAAAWRHLDRVELAADDVARALEAAPDNPEALLERGIIRQLRGDTAGARADWRRTIALAPDSATADLAQQNLALNEAGPQRR